MLIKDYFASILSYYPEVMDNGRVEQLYTERSGNKFRSLQVSDKRKAPHFCRARVGEGQLPFAAVVNKPSILILDARLQPEGIVTFSGSIRQDGKDKLYILPG
jgi:hypothetical protein